MIKEFDLNEEEKAVLERKKLQPLPKQKKFSFGRFSKRLSARFIMRKSRDDATERGMKKGMIGWRNPAREIKILERKANFGPSRGTEIQIKQGW